MPTYFIVSWSPGLAAGPLPTTMSLTTSCAGGSPFGFGIRGFLSRLLEIGPTAAAAPDDGADSVVVVAGGASVVVCVAVSEEEDADVEDDESSEPHPAARSASAARVAARAVRGGMSLPVKQSR